MTEPHWVWRIPPSGEDCVRNHEQICIFLDSSKSRFHKWFLPIGEVTMRVSLHLGNVREVKPFTGSYLLYTFLWECPFWRCAQNACFIIKKRLLSDASTFILMLWFFLILHSDGKNSDEGIRLKYHKWTTISMIRY